MHSMANDITQKLKQSFKSCGYATDSVLAIPSSHEADYQCNVLLSLAKQTKQDPKTLAEKVVQAFNAQQNDMVAKVSGPGFINITLSHSFLENQARQLLQTDRLGIKPSEHPLKIILDSGGPNIAKEMHVGHVRSAIIGEYRAFTSESTAD